MTFLVQPTHAPLKTSGVTKYFFCCKTSNIGTIRNGATAKGLPIIRSTIGNFSHLRRTFLLFLRRRGKTLQILSEEGFHKHFEYQNCLGKRNASILVEPGGITGRITKDIPVPV